MTWEIVLGIIALFGFITAVVGPGVKITRTLTILTTTLDNLVKTTAELEKTVKQNTVDIAILKEDKS